MTVYVLMYHRTPAAAEDTFDVSLPMFKAQMQRLRDADATFIPFSRANDPKLAGRGKFVAVTFDDGHGSNTEAFEHLARHGVRPAAFIVRDWCQSGNGAQGAGYLSGRDIQQLAWVCDFGAHGASHRGLAQMPPAEAAEELRASRAFMLEVVGREIDTMSLPGGDGSDGVLAEAARQGFRLIGNSVFAPHSKPSLSVNRIAITASRGADFPLRIIQAPALYWTARRARASLRIGLSRTRSKAA